MSMGSQQLEMRIPSSRKSGLSFSFFYRTHGLLMKSLFLTNKSSSWNSANKRLRN